MKIFLIILLLLAIILGCTGCASLDKLWPGNWFTKKAPIEEVVPNKILGNNEAVTKLFAHGNWLMSFLILGGVVALGLGMWIRNAGPIFFSVACFVGAGLLVTLAGWANVVGLLILVAGLGLLVMIAFRWKKVADNAIQYADDLKEYVTQDDKEKVNSRTERTQSTPTKKYVLEARKIRGL